MRLTSIFPVLCVFGCGVTLLDAQEASAKARQVDVARDVVTILQDRCFGCHGAEQQMSGLRLDSREGALRGGYSGPAIQPGKSAQSTLIQLISGVDPKRIMPLSGPRLAPGEIDTLRSWIDQGAKWPTSKSPPNDDALPSASGRSTHWSFQPVGLPKPPTVRDSAFARNPIDNFVLARLEAKGIKPSVEADKTTLLRRVSLDLTGLPPTL